MSSDIYSKPDLSHKVRYTRKAEEDRAKWQQKEVCIYESADDIDFAVSEPQEDGQQIQNQPVVKKPRVRRSTLCKGVLSLLVLAGLIILCIYFTVEFNKLNYSHSQQQKEILGKRCPEGWTRFGCSCYFRSTQTKSWYGSRTYCQDKGADLVIIDTEEEQKFVAELSCNGDSWIGLQGTRVAANQPYEWEWVDGSPLKTSYWDLGFPSNDWYYATWCSPQGKWKHSGYDDYKNWICEK